MTHRLWARLRHARIVRVIAIYLGASWIVLQVTNLLRDSLNLPAWITPVALILLLVGLVIIVATAWVQSHPLTAHKEAVGEVPSGGAVALGELKEEIARGRLPHLTWGRALAGGAFAFALLFGIAGLYVVVKDRGRTFEPGEAVAESSAAPGIAVLPFSVRGPEMEVWREGMVDLLSTGLDGAAGLRAIDSRTVLARWNERVGGSAEADLATALDVARRTGARYALVGSAVATGAELRLVADVYRLEDGASMGQARAEGAADSVLALADRFAVEVLKVILQKESELPRVDLARVTTASFPALKAYLEGEVLFRRGDFTAAIEAYEAAVDADSTFALAYYRLGNAYGWAETIESERADQAFTRAARLADRLPEREATLVLAERALFNFLLDGLEPLRQAVRRYPDDAEAWYLLGDTYYHLAENALVDYGESEPAFRRASELDPRFAPYRIHLVNLAFNFHADSAMAAREVAAHGRLAPGTRFDRAGRAAFPLAFGDPAARARGLAALDTLDLDVLRNLTDFLDHPRFAPEFDALEEAIIRRVTDPAARNRAVGRRAMLLALWTGRWREALGHLDELEGGLRARACPLFGLASRGYPVDQATLDGALALGEADTAPSQAIFCKAAYAADRGRWADHARVVAQARRYAEMALGAGDTLGARRAGAALHLLEGYGLWRRGQPEKALEEMRAAQRDFSDPQLANWWLAMLLLEMKRPDEAEPYLRSLRFDVLARYHLAKIWEERGERTAAREAYEAFAEYWKNADPDMQPLVQDARQGAIRLGGLRRG